MRAFRHEVARLHRELRRHLGGGIGPILRHARRGGRKVWSNRSRVYIELRESGEIDATYGSLATELERLAGVRWARVNASLHRMVIEFDAGCHTPQSLLAELERLEQAAEIDAELSVMRPEQHPGDRGPIVRLGFELGIDAAAFVAGQVLAHLRIRSLPSEVELAALLELVRGVPGVRKTMERTAGIAVVEIGLELVGATLQTLLHSQVGSLSSAINRGLRLRALVERRRVWSRIEPELCGTERDHESPPPAPGGRPRPLPDGRIESYTEKAVLGSLAAFVAGLLTTSDVEAAVASIFAGIPKPARHGRQAFTAHLGFRLARAGVLVLQSNALSRLDRIDCAVIDDRLLRGAEDPARALVAAIRAAGLRLVVSGDRPETARWAEPDELVGRDSGQCVRRLQAAGRGVLHFGYGSSPGYAVADCSVALRVPEQPPPWRADLFVTQIETMSAIVQATEAARRVAEHGIVLSKVEAGLGLLLALSGLKLRTTRRIMTAASLASIVSMANAVRLARRIELEQSPSSPQARRPPWHALPIDEVLERLEASPDGLNTQEAQARRGPPPARVSPVTKLGRLFVDELNNPMTPMLATGVGLSMLVGAPGDAALIGSVLVLNGAVGAAQRYRTERVLASLVHHESPRVRVRRDGTVRERNATELVPGDIIEVGAGDLVPADCRLLEGSGLEVDESSLTGESLPVSKCPEPTSADVMAERTSMLYDTTAIAAGRAVAVVTEVGTDTEARRAMAAGERFRRSVGVEARLDQLTRITAPLAAVSGLAVVAAGLVRKRPASELISAGVSLAVAAVPEGLPLIATMAQLAAAGRLSSRRALVRNPRAVEALGRINVLCADKTGTLTEGRIQLRVVSDGEHGQNLDELDDQHRAILSTALRASPSSSNGDPLRHLTDRALVEGANRIEVASHDGLHGWHRLDELPFEPSRGFHAGLGRHAGGQVLSVKGAPEVLLPRCVRWRAKGRETSLGERDRAALLEESTRLAGAGYRVLAVAEAEQHGEETVDGADVQELAFRGFVAFADPVRETARAAVDDMRAAGVDVVMITGDHPSTAQAIAAELGLGEEPRTITGPELDRLDEAGLDAIIGEVAVFARVTPMQKVRIVGAMQRAGKVVAMTGDGANDAPAIRLADVGIALGDRSTPAARAAADLVVTDGRIETIVHAALEGRALWVSVRDAVSVLVGGNLGEISFTLFGGLMTGRSPLNARQLLLVNLVTDTFPALAIALRPPAHKSPQQLRREGPEVSLGQPLTRDLAWRAAITAGTASAAWLGARSTGSRARADTVGMLTLTGTQLAQTLVLGGRSAPVLVASLGSLALTLAAVQTPGVSHFFGCRPLGPLGLLYAGAGTTVGGGAALWMRWRASR